MEYIWNETFEVTGIQKDNSSEDETGFRQVITNVEEEILRKFAYVKM